MLFLYKIFGCVALRSFYGTFRSGTYQGVLKKTSIIASPLFTDIVYVLSGPGEEKYLGNQIPKRRVYSFIKIFL